MTDSAGHSRLHVGIRCDAHTAAGLGHLVRQTALVEELLERGHQVSLFGTCDSPWGTRQAQRLGLAFEDIPEAELPAICIQRGIKVVMIDGYEIPKETGESLREADIGVASMVDGSFGRHQAADLYVDQNLGSELGTDDARWLVGTDYVLLRDVVLRQRGLTSAKAAHEVPRLLVVFGGSDPFGGCPLAVELALAAGVDVEVVAIAPTTEHRHMLESLVVGKGQRVQILDPQDDLPALAVECDIAVSAAGSTVWELACLGIPAALVCVTENQILGYQAATREAALGLGLLNDLKSDAEARRAATEVLRLLLTNSETRGALRQVGTGLVDGEGRRRVATELERLSQR